MLEWPRVFDSLKMSPDGLGHWAIRFVCWTDEELDGYEHLACSDRYLRYRAGTRPLAISGAALNIGDEAMECGAIIDVIRLLGVISDSELTQAKLLPVQSVGMLSKMCG